MKEVGGDVNPVIGALAKDLDAAMRIKQFMMRGGFRGEDGAHPGAQKEQHAGERKSRETHRILERRSLGHVHSAIGEPAAPGKQMRRAFAGWEPTSAFRRALANRVPTSAAFLKS